MIGETVSIPACSVPARSDRIDALKFFAIALVILGHVANLPQYGNVIGQAVYVIRAVNMPLFMFLSGYVLFGREGDSPMRFLKRKFLALMVPYFVWAVLGLGWNGVAPRGWIPALLQSAVNPHESGLKWFLYVLFVFYVLFTLARRITRHDWILVAAAALTVAFTYLPEGDYFGRLNVQWLFTFFVAGYLVAKHRDRVPRMTVRLAMLVFALFALLLVVGIVPDRGLGWPPWFISHGPAVLRTSGLVSLTVFLAWKYATAFAGIAVSAAAYILADKRWWQWQVAGGRRSLGMYVTQTWLVQLAVGAGVIGLLGSWVVVTFLAVAAALLLERSRLTATLLLGRPWMRPSPALRGDGA